MERWSPPVELSRQEKMLMKRLTRVRALFGFFRQHRHELFDDAFQEQLEGMYRTTGAGDVPNTPALLCMVVLLQGYVGASDAEAVELSLVDLRWQMCLGCLGADTPPFSQGGLQAFRERMIAHEMDRALLDRTVALVRSGTLTEGDGRAVSKALRAAIDSRPLSGAGKVEDTINLLGHAARTIVRIVSNLTFREPEEICRKAGIPLLLAPSIKAGLDIDWSAPEAKTDALNKLCRQLDRLMAWVARHLPQCNDAPLTRYIEALAQVREQDLEPRADGGVRIRQGVAADRRISIEDADMRHGRKSKSKRFNGYKQHISTDIDSELVLACTVLPANRPEEEATAALQADMARLDLFPDELLIDRGYVNSPLTEEVSRRGGLVLCKPWRGAGVKPDLFGKRDFNVNVRDGTITCPAGEVEPFEPGGVVHFDPEVCGPCPLRANCTQAASGKGRSVTMGDDERLQKKLRNLQQTRSGRQALRERVGVEHRLAHIGNRQGPKARYRGTRRNIFDTRRLSAVQNLETIARWAREDARDAA